MAEHTSSKDDLQNRGMTQSLFLNNLEQWIDEIISRDGLADRELIRTIKDRFEHSIQANIDYHKFMISAKENRDKTADRHRLMAEVYESLLQPGSKHG